MSGDAVQGPLVLIGGLPRQIRQRGCEVDRMLTGAAGNLQNHPSSGEKSPQDIQDRITVACHRRRCQDRIHVR
jgi:hypothetical protein